jgi:hypothetical protein
MHRFQALSPVARRASVDPPRRAVTVLVAGAGGRFTTERTVAGDEPACSTLLPGFMVRPSELIP